MLITHTSVFSGTPPTEFPMRSRNVLRPSRPRETCAICGDGANPWAYAFRFVWRRDRRHAICANCHTRYHDAAGQFARYGLRLRFVERREFREFRPTHNFDLGVEKWVYKFLLLARERQTLRQKEVTNRMLEETARLILKFPEKVARIVAATFVVRGEDARIDDCEALLRIRDLVEEIDPEMIDRVKNKRLP